MQFYFMKCKNRIKSILKIPVIQIIFFYNKAKILLRWGIDSAFIAMLKNRKQTVNDSVIKNVLLIKVDAIGDAVIWLDAFKHFREIYPPNLYKLTLVCNIIWFEIVKNSGYADEYIPIDREKLKFDMKYRYAELRSIYRTHYEITINTVFSRVFLVDDSIAHFSSSKIKIAHSGEFSNITKLQKRISDRCYTTLVENKKDNMMELERNAELLRALGLQKVLTMLPTIAIEKRIKNIDLEKYYVVFPGASRKEKQWPIDKMVEICQKVNDKYNIKGIICGGETEKNLGKELLLNTNNGALVDFTGKTKLLELCEIIKNSRLLISNDTSAIHIAVAVSTPSICILGGGHLGRFLPYKADLCDDRPLPVIVKKDMSCSGCNWRCIYSESNNTWPCISEIEVEQVWNAIEEYNFL